MATKLFIFEPTDLIRLFTHYSDGEIPLDCEVVNVGVNPMLQRFVGIECKSDEWKDFSPYHFRYDGKKVMGWTKGSGMEPVWTDSPEAPSRQ